MYALIGAPCSSKIDEIASINIEIVEALASFGNGEEARVVVVNILFGLLAFEVFDLSF